MCRRWSTSWPRSIGRALLALALLLAPLGAWRVGPVAAMPVCAAGGGVKLVPDPLAPAVPAHVHCDACLVAPPALPAPALVLRAPRAIGFAWATERATRAAPPALPPEQARAPPAT